MRSSVFVLLAITVLAFVVAISSSTLPINMWVGTGGDGYGSNGNPMGAQVPFGMMRVGPDTSMGEMMFPWRLTGGYSYYDTDIRAFSHVHMVGSGAMDLGLIGVMPIGEINGAIALAEQYRSPYNHSTEVVDQPGYYAVTLDRWDVRCELTATNLVAFHRYTYGGKGQGTDRIVLFDMAHELQLHAEMPDSFVTIDPVNRQVTGSAHNNGALSGRFGGARVFFVAEFDDAFTDYGVMNNFGLQEKETSVTSAFAGGWVKLGSGAGVVNYRVAISFISVEQAQENLKATLSQTPTFESAQEASAGLWSKLLNTVQIPDSTGGDSDQLTTLYSTLYHVFASPTNFTEANNQYRGIDAQVHQTDGSWTYYTDFSLWDTHRTEHPLLALLAPQHTADMIRSLLTMAEQGGDLPRWPFLYGTSDKYTGCMFGTHSVEVIAGAYFSGIPIDTETAYKYMYAQAIGDTNHGRGNTRYYNTIGYVPVDVDNTAASTTLSYAKSDGVLALFASALGKAEDAALFHNRSLNYQNIFQSKDQFFCNRFINGSWNCPNDWKDEFGNEYTEGDAYNYRFDVNDGPGIVSLFGGNALFTKALNDLFVQSMPWPSYVLPNPFYWAGNEEDLLFPYLFHYSNAAPLTCKWVRWLLLNRYDTNKPDALPGNDDYGTMSAWYTFSTLGLYPLAGKGVYFVGSPVFAQSTVQLQKGVLTITAHNTSAVNIYPQQINLNGQQLDVLSPIVSFAEIENGGKLEMIMGPNMPQEFAREHKDLYE